MAWPAGQGAPYQMKPNEPINTKPNHIHLEKDPVVGMAWTKDPKMLQMPSATISWLASTGFPPAWNKMIMMMILYVPDAALCLHIPL